MTDPFLYDTVNELYHSVMDHMPVVFQKRDIAGPFILGGLGAYGIVRALQLTSERMVNKAFPGFDELVLPLLERICQIGVISLPFVYALFDPEGAKAIITQHPSYTSGMAGTALGAIMAAERDINKKTKPKTLEEEIKKPVVYPPIKEKDL